MKRNQTPSDAWFAEVDALGSAHQGERDRSLVYYRFLGLPRTARRDTVTRRCRELLDWLGSDDVPRDLRPWARQQAALVAACQRSLLSQADTVWHPDELALLLGETTPYAAAWRRWWRPAGAILLGLLLGLVVVGTAYWGLQGRGDGAVSPGGGSSSGAQVLAAQRERIARLEAVVAADPAAAAALFELGWTYMDAEQWQPAVDWFSRLLQLDPATVPPSVDLIQAQLEVGIASINLGRYDVAEPLLLQVASRRPQDPQVHFVLGVLYAGSPRPDQVVAAQHWQEVIRLAPDSQWARLAKPRLDALRGGAPAR